MAIQKYGRTYFYGYGYTDMSFSPVRYYFLEKVSVVDKSLTGSSNEITVDPVNNGIMLDLGEKYGDGKPRLTRLPLYIIFDGESWQEYFSGTVLSVISKKTGSILDYPHTLAFNKYDIDKDNDFGVRELSIGFEGIQILEAKDFANEISKYNDKQIKNMVQQLYAIINNAKLWGDNLDKIIQDVRNRRDNINTSSASKLENGIGKYANINMNNEQNNSGYKAPQDETSTNVTTKSNPGCFGVLMLILLPIISLITIIGVYL